jgi:DNA-directed RNA polymerase specialized sigma24 family protein
MGSNWYAHVFMDPSDMEKFFSNENALSNFQSSSPDELPEESYEDMGKVKQVLHLIPPREADFVELYYFSKIKQSAIAEIFGVSQPTICYRLQRAVTRIQYLLGMPPHDPQMVKSSITPVLGDPIDIDIMMLMLETTCQSEVARKLSVSQGFVRHRFFRSIGKIKQDSVSGPYVPVFEHVSKHLNVLKSDDKLKSTEPILFRIV